MYFPNFVISQNLSQNLLCLIRQCISGLNVPRRLKYWWWWNTTLLSVILAGSESEKSDEIMDRVGWLKESFDRYSRINRFINNSVGHLCRELGGGGVSRNDKQRICAIRWSQLVTFRIITCLTNDCIFEFSDWELLHIYVGGRRSRDSMVDGFTTTYAISTYHHWCCEF